MKKILFFSFALLATMAAKAEVVTIASNASGNLPNAYGAFSGQTFTTNATSGLEGVTVTASTGLTINEATVNVSHYGKCFSLITAAAATDYTVTMAVPDGYVITGYTLGCSANTSGAVHTLTSEDGTVSVVASAPPYNTPTGPKAFEVSGLDAQSTYFTISTANKANTLYLPTFTITYQKVGATYVNVTYNLYESDGTTLVSSEEVSQETNSAVSVPASLTASTYYDYASSGTIGDTDCSISVIRTLKNGIVYPYTNLSNTKAYSLVVPRGTYTTNDGYLANTVKNSSYAINKFAFIKYEDNYYMWSVTDSKFAGNSNALTDTPQAITFESISTPEYKLKSGSLTLNASSGQTTGAAFDSWSTTDEGNRCVIYESDDFDPTAALAVLEEYFHPTAEKLFNDAIAQLETIPYGTGTNQYSLTVESTDYTTQAATIISGLRAQGYSADNLTVAQQLLAGTALNMPSAGLYRIKGATSGNYLSSGTASSKYAMTNAATDANTIFYFDGTNLINCATGKYVGVNSSSWAWQKDVANASDIAFQDGLTNGGYAIKCANINLYDNGTNADRGGNLTIDENTNVRYTSWMLEQVTTLSLTLNSGESQYWATTCYPFGYTLPAGTEAYRGEMGEGVINLHSIGQNVPAGTPVVLNGAAAGVEITVDNSIAALTEANDLQGQKYAGDDAADENKLALGIYNGVVGFYKYTDSLGAFKAYLNNTTSTPSNGFQFVFDDVTGLNNIVNISVDGQLYDLQGRKVVAPEKGGLYIKGGKVVKY